MTKCTDINRIEGLDLLRGFAVLLVLLRHAFPNIFGGGGIVGVVIFFTLSGYLITGILVRDIQKYNKIRYTRFYRNRVFRLVPALMFLLLGIVVISFVFDPLNDSHKILRTILVAITYTANLPFCHGSETIGHLWTLATEEQFYLIWPLLLLLGIRYKKMQIGIPVIGSFVYFLCIVSLLYVAPAYENAYELPFSWTVAMTIGASAFFGQFEFVKSSMFKFHSNYVTPIISLLFLICMSFIPDLKKSLFAYVFVGPCIAFFTILLIDYLKGWKKVSTTYLKPLLWLGYISYAAYLWNYPIVVWLHTYKIQYTGIISIVLTIIAAIISFVIIERPFMLLKYNMDCKEK